MRVRLKELKELTSKKYIEHLGSEHEKFSKTLSEYVDARFPDESFRVDHSYSSEGGIAIPWSKIDSGINGEMLHLRFYSYPDFSSDEDKWCMQFVLNNHGFNKWNKLSDEQLHEVIKALKELIKYPEAVLTYIREPSR